MFIHICPPKKPLCTCCACLKVDCSLAGDKTCSSVSDCATDLRKAWQVKARHGRARQGKSGQGMTGSVDDRHKFVSNLEDRTGHITRTHQRQPKSKFIASAISSNYVKLPQQITFLMRVCVYGVTQTGITRIPCTLKQPIGVSYGRRTTAKPTAPARVRAVGATPCTASTLPAVGWSAWYRRGTHRGERHPSNGGATKEWHRWRHSIQDWGGGDGGDDVQGGSWGGCYGDT